MSEANIESLYPMAYTNTRVPYLKIYTVGNDNRLKAVGEIPLGTAVVVTGMDLIDNVRVQKLGIGEGFYIRDDEFANGDEPEVIAQDIETNVTYDAKTPYPTDDYYMGRINTPNGAAFYGPEETLFYKSRGLSKGQKIWLRGVSMVGVGETGYDMAYLKSKKTGKMEFIGYVKSSIVDIEVVTTTPFEEPSEPVTPKDEPIQEPIQHETDLSRGRGLTEPIRQFVEEEAPVQDTLSKIATMEEGPDKEATKNRYLNERLGENIVIIALHTDSERKLANVNQYIDTKLCYDTIVSKSGDADGYAALVAAGFNLLPYYMVNTFVGVREEDLVGLKKDMVRHGLKPIICRRG